MVMTDLSRPIAMIPALLIQYLLLLSCAPLACAQPSRSNSPPDASNLPYKFNPSMLIIIFVLISAFFCMGFFSIYIRQCAGDSSTVHGSRRGGVRIGRSRRNRGLEPAVIDTFPILEYSAVKDLKIGKGTLECAVCLNEFEDDDTLRLINKCSHVFHPECIDAWLSSHTTCPVCRADLSQGSEAPVVPEAEAVVDRGAVSAGEAEESDHVAIDIVGPPAQAASGGEAQAAEVINPSQMPFPIQNRPIRNKSSRRPSRFPRSHSTGHSIVQPGENVERYTLRLPVHVRKEIASRQLNRTTSLLAYPAEGGGEGSSRGGGRWFRGIGGGGGGGGEGSSRGRTGFAFGRSDRLARSDRWVFSKTLPFVSRTASVKSQKKVDSDTTGSFKGGFPSVMTPFDCLGAKGESSSGQETARGSTPVFSVTTR